MPVINGVTYNSADFLGDGYVSRFPSPVFDDMLAEFATQQGTMVANLAAQNAAIAIKINGIIAPGVASLTSLTIGTGAKNFTLTQTASITRGEYKAFSSSNPNNFMIVRLAADTSSSTAFNTTCDIVGGSGTITDWVIVPLSTPFRYAQRSVSGATNVDTTDLGAIIVVTSGTFTITATAAATLLAGHYFAIANNGSGTITFNPNASETIDGNLTMTLLPGESAQIFCDGTKFLSLGSQVVSHSLLTKHTIAGGTAGTFLRVTGATTFALQAIQASDLPAETQLAAAAGQITLWSLTRYGR